MFGVQGRPWPQIPSLIQDETYELDCGRPGQLCPLFPRRRESRTERMTFPLFPAGRALKIIKALGIGWVLEKGGPGDQDIGPGLDDAPGIVQSDSAVYLDVAGTVLVSDQSGQVGHLVQGKGNK